MKKSLLSFMIIGQTAIILAQTNVYHPFPSDSAAWSHEDMDSFGNDKWGRQELLGDTVINSVLYKKLFNLSYDYTIKNFAGGLRQDIPNKKVYIINAASGVESILYDFNMAIGDTIYKKEYFDTVFVSKIDSTLIGSNYHKTYILSSTSSYIQTGLLLGKIIEGVGSTAGLGELYIGGFEFSHALRCFSTNNTRLFVSPSSLAPYTCYLSVSVGFADISQKEIKISISPNPTKDNISLSVGCNDTYNIEIKNNIGQSVYYKGNLMHSELKIDLSDYKPGIYFVRINDLKGNFVVKKIVKE